MELEAVNGMSIVSLKPVLFSLSSRVCTNGHAIIRKYALNICRQYFRERASQIGFLKVCFNVYSINLLLRLDKYHRSS